MPDANLYLPLSYDDAPVCSPGPDGRCSVCADEAIPGRLVELGPDGLGRVELPDGPQDVALDLIDDPQPGDWLLVHLGFAIARLDTAP